MSGQGRAHYLSMGKIGFKQAVIHLLETEYKIVGDLPPLIVPLVKLESTGYWLGN